MVTTKLNLSMTEPSVRQIYAKQGDTGRVLDISLDQTPEDGTLRILRPDGVEVTSEAVTGGEVESGSSFDSLTEADVTELTVGIEPVQDLNGYDKPWVGGAGKNLFNSAGLNRYEQNGITVTQPSVGTLVFNGTATASAFFSIVGTGYSRNTYAISLNNTAISSGLHIAIADSSDTGFLDMPCDATNKTTTFTNEPSIIRLYVVSGTTLSNFVVKPQLEVGSTATEWQPYSNICPITGHDEVRVTRTGKNLLDASAMQSGFRSITVGDSYSSITASNRYKHGDAIPAQEGLAVSFKTADLNTFNWITVNMYNNDVLVARYIYDIPSANVVYSYIVPSNTYEYIALNIGAKAGYTVDASSGEIQVELGLTATDYEPYRSNTYTTSLGQTVYGGTLDMVTGVLTVDKATVTFNGSEGWSWSTDGNTNRVWRAISDAKPSAYQSILGNFVSAENTLNNYPNLWKAVLNGNTPPSLIIGVPSSIASADDFKTMLNTTNLQVVYELATPTVINLTPQQIKTLVGTNNVWASSGDIVSIKFTYGGLLSELPSDATSVVGKCYCDVEQNGVSSMPFTLNVKKNERQ